MRQKENDLAFFTAFFTHLKHGLISIHYFNDFEGKIYGLQRSYDGFDGCDITFVSRTIYEAC